MRCFASMRGCLLVRLCLHALPQVARRFVGGYSNTRQGALRTSRAMNTWCGGVASTATPKSVEQRQAFAPMMGGASGSWQVRLASKWKPGSHSLHTIALGHGKPWAHHMGPRIPLSTMTPCFNERVVETKQATRRFKQHVRKTTVSHADAKTRPLQLAARPWRWHPACLALRPPLCAREGCAVWRYMTCTEGVSDNLSAHQ